MKRREEGATWRRAASSSGGTNMELSEGKYPWVFWCCDISCGYRILPLSTGGGEVVVIGGGYDGLQKIRVQVRSLAPLHGEHTWNTHLRMGALVGVRVLSICCLCFPPRRQSIAGLYTDSESVESPSYLVGLSNGMIDGALSNCSKNDGGRDFTAVGARIDPDAVDA